ncbi:PLDc N-terminal domain-containing protein [Cellulomonas fengjieae]|uniref:PLDc N-terminal domain-containing protein n=1 Tax=Cellulomonas fengjieae TaxID=2819978 RepID=A0ABS3SCK4_9CELL|nr:PLDc N-terminal domain-containing protein [Cellulomonas fengjieae]MBO3083476.1 PLDc N-terminal domain-containing protein [Cellulomonas fengjieae]MBO3101773.1 PLDc N-terminal domain-containing protein [Cellulomonas fengjieae]QVI65197.1 PLDc N-terminal domain-containing protein [Cellulomonas fengjieae]
MRNLAVLLIIGVTIYCVIDVLRSSAAERLGVHKGLWVLLVLVVPVLGPLAWLGVRWSRRSSGGPTQAPNRGRTTGPDDDPDFLSRLDEEHRRTDPGTSDGPPAA